MIKTLFAGTKNYRERNFKKSGVKEVYGLFIQTKGLTILFCLFNIVALSWGSFPF